MSLPVATADSPDIRVVSAAGTRVALRVVQLSAGCVRGQVLRGVFLLEPLPGYCLIRQSLLRRALLCHVLLRHVLSHHCLPEISIISAAGMIDGIASGITAMGTGVDGAPDIRMPIHT